MTTLLATAPTPLSRWAVKATLCKEYREVRCYAAAVRANLPESPTKEPGLQRPIPGPRRSILLPVRPSTASPFLSPPAEPAEDLWDALIVSLLAVLRAVGDALPQEHSLHAVCLAALNGQSGTTLLY